MNKVLNKLINKKFVFKMDRYKYEIGYLKLDIGIIMKRRKNEWMNELMFDFKKWIETNEKKLYVYEKQHTVLCAVCSDYVLHILRNVVGHWSVPCMHTAKLVWEL